jgi:glucosamine--fructose-6-phosphate aminotransferase (isomerizing)
MMNGSESDMKKPGEQTYGEIGNQHEAMKEASRQLAVQRDWVERYIGNAVFDEVIFIGSGSSYYQAQVMASTFRKWLGRSASAFPSSEILLFRDTAVAAGKSILLVGVSRSGESTEVILALESVSALPNWTICGITCYEDSRLFSLADCLVSPLGKEKSTVMTKSFSSMTFMMQSAIALATGKDRYIEELRRTESSAAYVTEHSDRFVQQLVQDHDFDKFIYLGMGAFSGLAQEASLKIKEMSYVWTESYGTLEFRHGPKSIVEPGTLVVLFLSEHARNYELKVAEEMKAYGASILLLVSESGPDTEFADYVLNIGNKDLSDAARAVLYMPPVQYLGYYTALKRNADPDSPRNLTQVVKI